MPCLDGGSACTVTFTLMVMSRALPCVQPPKRSALALCDRVVDEQAASVGDRRLDMKGWKIACVLALLPLVIGGCEGVGPLRLAEQQDHAGLVSYYAREAQTLRQKAQEWEFMAEFYGMHPESYTKIDPAQHEAHCRAIAQSYRKAAEEAEALARLHRNRLPEPRRD